MGFLSGLFSSSSESKQESTSQQTTTQESQQTQTGKQIGTTTETGKQQVAGTTAGTTIQKQQDIVSQLGSAERDILADLISRLGITQAEGGGADLLAAITQQSAGTDPAVLGALSERALTFGDQRERIQEDLRAAATQRFQDTTERQVSQAQQQIGASGEFNTASRLLDLEAERKLGVDLAGLSAQTDLQLNQQEEAALLAALSGSGIAGATAAAGSSAPLTELLQALQLSRGSQVITERTAEEQQKQTTSQVTTTEQQTQQLIETLQELVASGTSSTKGSGTTTTTGTSQSPILGQILSAFTGVVGGINSLNPQPQTIKVISG